MILGEKSDKLVLLVADEIGDVGDVEVEIRSDIL